MHKISKIMLRRSRTNPNELRPTGRTTGTISSGGFIETASDNVGEGGLDYYFNPTKYLQIHRANGEGARLRQPARLSPGPGGR